MNGYKYMAKDSKKMASQAKLSGPLLKRIIN